MNRSGLARAASIVVPAIVLAVAAACSGGSGAEQEEPSRAATILARAPSQQPLDVRGPGSQISYGDISRPLRDMEQPEDSQPPRFFPARPTPRPQVAPQLVPDTTTVQREIGPFAMPATGLDFLGQGATLGMCDFDAGRDAKGPNCTTTGLPPDTNGAVGAHHYVQLVNGGIGIWDKTGTLVMTPKLLNTVWAGYTCTHVGCACATQNDGDPVVIYDPIADRWLVAQFSLPGGGNTPPSYTCVAVSTTGDPTGSWARYDYSYNTALNDYTKWGVWTDSFLSTFNSFGNGSADVCAFDKAAMLAGGPAAMQCTGQLNNYFSILPAGVEGQIPPPNGEPALYATDDGTSQVQIWTYKAAWPAATGTFSSGPVSIAVNAFASKCGGNDCVPEPSPGNLLQALDDRPMFRLAYRNFGDHEALLMNHTVSTGSGAGSPTGLRWWEIRAPASATPEVYQQGSYAPADSNYRWLGSMAQDQAGDFALGFSEASSTTTPLIAWTGRLATDALGTMAQGEAVVHAGGGVETGSVQGQTADRWGDYSAMTVDPTDDCTFWYTNQIYPSNGTFNWDTYVATFKFPRCAANDFTIDVSPATANLPQGSTVQYTVSVASTVGTPETVALYVQNLPAGVTGAFNPTSVLAGNTSILTLTAAATASNATATFMVIGTAPSAVHPATADVVVGSGGTDAGTDSGTGDSGGMMSDSGGTTDSGGMTDSGGKPDAGGTKDSGSGSGSSSGGTTDSGSAQDSGHVGDSGGMLDSGSGGGDSGSADAAEEGDASAGSGNSGNSSGCGCRTVDSPYGSSSAPLLALAGAIAVTLRRRRRSTCTS
jgi:MYXO-CTERM domain-containing protein